MLSNQSQNQSSDSVPSSSEAREPAVTTSQHKMSKAETVALIAMEIGLSIEGISIVSACSWQEICYPVIVFALIVLTGVTLTVSDIIHNRVEVVTGAILIGLALLTIAIMMFIGIVKSGI